MYYQTTQRISKAIFIHDIRNCGIKYTPSYHVKVYAQWFNSLLWTHFIHTYFWFETVRNEIVLERTLTVSIYRHENKNIFSGSFCFGMYDVSNSSFKGWKVKFWWLLIICCKLTWIIMMNFQWVSKAIYSLLQFF